MGSGWALTARFKYEFVVFDNEALSLDGYKAVEENKKAKATYLAKYDPEFWQGYTIIEPNTAIRAFTIEE